MLAKFLVRAVFAALGLWVASVVLRDVYVANTGTLVVAAIRLSNGTLAGALAAVPPGEQAEWAGQAQH